MTEIRDGGVLNKGKRQGRTKEIYNELDSEKRSGKEGGKAGETREKYGLRGKKLTLPFLDEIKQKRLKKEKVKEPQTNSGMETQWARKTKHQKRKHGKAESVSTLLTTLEAPSGDALPESPIEPIPIVPDFQEVEAL